MLSLSLATSALSEKTPPRNLLLITIDTLRADHLSCNDPSNAQTPHLDRLAAGGVNFTRARASVPLTLPSHASILTGNYPPTHTVRDNGSAVLPSDQETLAERLRSRGYRTAAFVASFVLDHRFGLDQGFDLYDDRVASDIGMLERIDSERPARAVVDAFQSWLEGHPRSKPFFAWVHFFDPHTPYAPPEPFRGLYADRPYAGEVAYVDHQIGRVLDDLETRGLLAQTLIAVVGDHGEGLGEHGERTHGLLIHNSTLHVPMILHAPGLVQSKRSVASLVRTIDLGPTVLDLLAAGESLGEGRSLRKLIEGTESDTSMSAYAESLYARLHLGWSEQRGLEQGRYRLVLTPAPELYDLAADPGETTSIATDRRDLLRRLRKELEALSERFPKASSGDGELLDADAVARLRSLGYLSGSPAPTSVDPADPKSKLAVWDRIERAMAHFAEANYAGAASDFELLLEVEPGIPLLYQYLGACFMQLERWGDAEAIYRRALRRGFESASTHVDMGRLLLRRGEVASAQRSLEAALEKDPAHVEALYRLGDLHRSRARNETAIDLYRQALEINRDYVYAWNGLAIALSAAGRGEEALAAFTEAVRAAPQKPIGHLNLAFQLEHLGRLDEARKHYARFLELSTDDLDLAGERQRALDALERIAARDR